jgi:hypothetical protein
MMRMKYTFSLLAGALFCASPLQAQISLELLSTPDSLRVDVMGDPGAEDYGAVPYGKGHLLFSSNRNSSALTPKDPQTNKPLPSLYLMRLSDRKVIAYKGNEAINDLKYYVGPAALLPDSSAIIMNHSRQKADSQGNVRMTLSQFSFSGAANSELPFIDPAANYVHPFFDEESYTLYFASDVGHEGNYDIYQSTLSFDGVWSQPSAVANVNTEASEVFPTLLPGQIMAFSRATRNYGLQLHIVAPGDTAATALAINGRGDDMGLLQINDTTFMAAQSKRKGGVSNFIFYTLLPKPTPAQVVEETTDSTAMDSTALTAVVEETDEAITSGPTEETTTASISEATAPKKNTWVTDDTPEPGTVKGYSIIVGGFIERGLADKFLNEITKEWAPGAFLSRYNDKYYVVHSMHKSRTEANAAKAAINDKGKRAWILSTGLQSI